MTQIDWYFDFISPYAYLQFCQLEKLNGRLDISYRPVLFAGFLNQWGHKGPAEIPGKRVYTFRQAQWLASRDRIPYRLPPHHPFNPIRALRLAIASGNDEVAIGNIFRAIWVDGFLPDNDEGWREIARAVGREDADQAISAQQVKDELRQNGERAIEAGVFGVPTSVVDGALFWGQDSTDFLLDYIDNPNLFDDPDMKKIDTTTPSATRTAD